jgi:hypothetical protein
MVEAVAPPRISDCVSEHEEGEGGSERGPGRYRDLPDFLRRWGPRKESRNREYALPIFGSVLILSSAWERSNYSHGRNQTG